MGTKKSINIIGVTGPSGAGKSTVSGIFKNNGCAVVDADITAREVVEPGTECIKKIQEFFGEEVINEDGSLNRKEMGDIVFTNQLKLKKLNQITHPFITEKIKEDILNYEKNGYKNVIIDAAVLFESGIHKMCDIIVSVISDEQKRLQRIMKRDNIDMLSAQNRISSQPENKFYIDSSDYIVYNNDNLTELTNEIKNILERICL